MRRLVVAAGLSVSVAAAAFAQSPEPSIPAQLVPSRHTTLSAELAAKIDRITVKDGDRFEAGQTLVAFDCTLQRALLDEALALSAAAEKTRDVHRRLLELNSIGLLEVEKVTAEAVVARAKVNSAKALVSKCAIAAPFDGRVVERKAQAHQYVQAGQPLLDILDDASPEIEFIVPSLWVRKLKVGSTLEIRVDETGKSYSATISRIGAKVDSVSHSVRVMALFPGRFPELMAGMTGKIRLAGS